MNRFHISEYTLKTQYSLQREIALFICVSLILAGKVKTLMKIEKN